MSPRLLPVLFALLAAPGSAAAAAGDISFLGRLGGRYTLLTFATEAPGSALNVPQWDWFGDLAVAGGRINPAILLWDGRLEYLGLRNNYGQTRSAVERLGFGLNTYLLSKSPVPLRFTASRSSSDQTSETGPISAVGATLSTSYLGSASLVHPKLPTANLTLSRNTTDNYVAGVPTLSSASTALMASVAQSRPGLLYGLTYNTIWNTGAYADRNYQSHDASLRLMIDLSRDTQFNLTERYFLRVPKAGAPSNPRIDANDLSAVVQWRTSPRWDSSATYQFNRSLVSGVGLTDGEQLNHLLSAQSFYQLSQVLGLRGGLSAAYGLARVEGVESSGLGQSVNAGLTVNHLVPWGWAFGNAGGAVGLVEPSTGGVQPAYEVNGQVGTSSAWRWLEGEIRYNGRYSRGGPAVSGWTLSQGLQVVAYSTAGRTWRVRAALDALDSRREDRLLGSFQSRSGQATVRGSWRTFHLELIAGLTDGVAAPLVTPGVGGGLLLPSSYNTRTTFAGATAGAALGNFYLSTSARTALISAPERATVSGRTFIASAGYFLGKFLLTLEERYADERSGPTQQSTNQLWLKLERVFDARL